MAVASDRGIGVDKRKTDSRDENGVLSCKMSPYFLRSRKTCDAQYRCAMSCCEIVINLTIASQEKKIKKSDRGG